MEISLSKSLERKKKEQIHMYKEEQIGECPFAISQYNLVANLYTKFEISVLKICGDIFDKNLERQKKEEI